MFIKTCGLTDAKEVESITQFSAFVGFIYYPPSKRCVSEAPSSKDAIRTGVFVNETPEKIQFIIYRDNLDCVQFHGNESVELIESIKSNLKIKAFGIDADFDFNITEPYEGIVDYFLFDTKTTLYGGSGIQFNWNKLQEYKGSTPFLLSGGIGPHLVNDIKAFHHPQFIGVDLNSGFEFAPGKKNIEQLKTFIYELNY